MLKEEEVGICLQETGQRQGVLTVESGAQHEDLGQQSVWKHLAPDPIPFPLATIYVWTVWCGSGMS